MQRFFAFGLIVYDFGMSRHGQAGDFHRLRRIVIDRERNTPHGGHLRPIAQALILVSGNTLEERMM